MSHADFSRYAVGKFEGCDSDEISAGTPEHPSIWLFGIEFGSSKASDTFNDNYSIERQLQYSYNLKAFKLLSVINGGSVKDCLRFAEIHQPFVRGQAGYFKGNLFPYAFKSVSSWTPEIAAETGMGSKTEYQQWCREHRLPAINEWIEKHRPKILIGLGISFRDDFSRAMFGSLTPMVEHVFHVGKQRKRLFTHTDQWKRLIVLPHFSGAHGLNSDESIEYCGNLIAKIIKA